MLRKSIMSYFIKKKWRKANVHNKTHLISVEHLNSVKVGKCTYGSIDIIKSDDVSKLSIGNYCSIAEKVKFVLGADHPLNYVSTYPFKALILKSQRYEAVSKGNIIVDDDVWIGYGATILSGVHIHQGAVIAAGAVVTKDVPPYAIVGGVPSKVIRYRFERELIDRLLQIDYSALTNEQIIEHIDELYKSVDIASINWMPTKKGSI